MAKPQRGKQQPDPHTETEETKKQPVPAGKDTRRKHRRTNAETTSSDITGINPDKMKPIDPRMVYMPPA